MIQFVNTFSLGTDKRNAIDPDDQERSLQLPTGIHCFNFKPIKIPGESTDLVYVHKHRKKESSSAICICVPLRAQLRVNELNWIELNWILSDSTG